MYLQRNIYYAAADLDVFITFKVSWSTTDSQNIGQLAVNGIIPSGVEVNASPPNLLFEILPTVTYQLLGSLIDQNALGWWDFYLGDADSFYIGDLIEFTIILPLDIQSHLKAVDLAVRESGMMVIMMQDCLDILPTMVFIPSDCLTIVKLLFN